MSELARIVVRDEDDLRVVEISGELDASNAEEARQAALDLFANSAHGIIFDLRQLSYIDSAGIALLFEIAERLGRRGQSLALVVTPSAVIRRALEVTEIGEMATVVPTIEAARARVLPNDERGQSSAT
jgi:anti-anti-sigma factor